MTSVFDALARILAAYEECFNFEDYQILSSAIQAMHDLQHAEGTHRIDSFIEKQIMCRERFHKWMSPLSANELAKEIKRKVKAVE